MKSKRGRLKTESKLARKKRRLAGAWQTVASSGDHSRSRCGRQQAVAVAQTWGSACEAAGAQASLFNWVSVVILPSCVTSADA